MPRDPHNAPPTIHHGNPTDAAAPRWFSRDRFGLFVHWGIYALNAWHEQDQQRRSIPRDEYVKLAERFNPVEFDPDKWIDLMDAAGMRYIVLTTKHHDGFCLWDTQLTDYKITNTPYGQDVVAQLAEACHRRGITLGLYYSVVDWHHPNYPNEGRHHELPPQPGDSPNMPKYVDFLKGQIRELLTNYGDVGFIWWDMNVPEYHDPSVHAMIRELQPQCMINERGFHDYTDPDAARKENLVVAAEREYGHHDGEDIVAGFGKYTQPFEACNSIDALSWGWKADGDLYTNRHIESAITQALVRGGNYLLNVGPDELGRIPQTQADALRTIGTWYRRCKEALVGVEPCQHLSQAPGVTLSRRGNDLYVALTNPPTTDAVQLKPIDLMPTEATLLNSGQPLEARVDTVPNDITKAYLRVRGLPVNERAGEVLVIRLRFDDLPERIDTVAGGIEQI